MTHKSLQQLQLSVERWIEKLGFLTPHLTIEVMASEIGTNRAYLSSYINSKYHKSFRNWVADIRLEYSRKLLIRDQNLTIVDAAEIVQYSQSSYSTIFKKHYGISPSQWRYGRQR